VSSNAAVFNKTLPYSPGHKANINYEGACRGHSGGGRERERERESKKEGERERE